MKQLILSLILFFGFSASVYGQCSVDFPDVSIDVESNAVGLSWADASVGGALVDYEVFFKTSAAATFIKVSGCGSPMSCRIEGLNSVVAYDFRVKAIGDCGGTSPTKSTTMNNITTLPITPVAAAATNISSTSFTANWIKIVTGETGYRLDVSTNSFFSTLLTIPDVSASTISKNVTGLTPGTAYFYRVKALNTTAGVTSNSSAPPISVLTLPDKPTTTNISDLDLNITATTFDAKWNSAAGATSYFLDVSTVADFSSFLTGYNNLSVNGTSATVVSGTPLSPGTLYFYRARAKATVSNPVATSVSLSSDPKTVLTLPNVPTITSQDLNITATTFDAKWNATTGATSYLLDVSIDENFNSFLPNYQNFEVNGTTATVGTTLAPLSPGTTYYYRVRAKTTATNPPATSLSGYSTPKSLLTLPTNPGVASITPQDLNITATVFEAKWNAATGATGYFLDVSTVADFSSFLTGYNNLSVNGTSTTVGSAAPLSPGTFYFYRVRAKATVSNPAATSVSLNSDPKTVLTLPDVPTTTGISDLDLNITGTTFDAKWNSATGATSYLLDISTDENFNSFLPNYQNFEVDGTTATVGTILAPLSPGTAYYYRVRAKTTTTNPAATSLSGYSVTELLLTLPAKPDVASITQQDLNITATTFDAKWNSATGATSYLLDVSTEVDFSSFLTGYNNLSVNGTSTAVGSATPLSPGTLYFYRVRAQATVSNPAANSVSLNSDPKSVLTLPDKPTAIAAANVTSSSFLAKWNAETSASGYLVDVSEEENFGSFVYINKDAGNNTSLLINGLTPGTTYHYQVRAIKSSTNPAATSTSLSSNKISQLTLPAIPLNFVSSDITTTDIKARWDAVFSATGYELEVSRTPEFDDVISGYDPKLISGNLTTEHTINGLVPGTTYHLRIRAKNASGLSGNSSLSLPTLTLAPELLLPASAITTTSFTANWSAPDGATSYQLDVATNESFVTLLNGYANVPVATTSKQVVGLLPGTNYHYRVRAVNSTGSSASSAPAAQLTLPAAPQNFKAIEPQRNSIKAEWSQVESASAYELEVSRNQNFTDLVNGYNPKIISGILEEVVTGLLPSTKYFFRIRAINSSGLSAYSDFKTNITLSPGGDVLGLILKDVQFPEVHIENEINKITIKTQNASGAVTVDFYHRSNSEREFIHDQATLSTGSANQYEVTIDNQWLDDFGMEFYFKAKDEAGLEAEDGRHIILKGIANVSIPLSRFGRTENNYHIISIPFDLEKKGLNELFVTIMGAYDKSKWRLMQYSNRDNANQDFEDGLSVQDIERGRGYWFISKNEVLDSETRKPGLSFGKGKSFDNTADKPFVLTLKEGWNQIGNPFPYNLSWDDVRESGLNEDVSTVIGDLLVYDHENSSLIESDALKVFEGGFVFADRPSEVIFSIAELKNTGGRSGDKGNRVPFDENNSDWFLPITLTQGGLTNKHSGIGMHHEASVGKDRWDVVTLPRFVRYLEFNSRNPESKFQLSRSIVPTKDEHTWEYSLASNSSGPIEMEWDKSKVENMRVELILYDLTNHVLINMAKENKYTTSKPASFVIYYSRAKTIEFDQLILGEPYPNPFESVLTIPIAYLKTESAVAQHTMLTIFDLNGRVVATASAQKNENRLVTLQWDGNTKEGFGAAPGMYVYKVISIANNAAITFSGKVIKK